VITVQHSLLSHYYNASYALVTDPEKVWIIW